MPLKEMAMSVEVDGLRDDQWERVKGFVPGGTKGQRGPRTDNRRFLDALLWKPARVGAGKTCRSPWATTER